MGLQAARCPNCREPALRKKWGCDSDAQMPVWCGTCPACLGGGCEACGQSGQRYHMRCPSSMSGWEGRRVIERVVAFENGILPGPGSYGEQMHTGMIAISLARSEQGRIERAMMESSRKSAKEPSRG